MATLFLEKHKNLLKNVKTFKQRMVEENKDGNSEPIQQSDYLKDFLDWIRVKGLPSAYHNYGDNEPSINLLASQPQLFERTESNEEYDVIVVGAGMTGISAAYELKKAGLKVLILEQTERIGGRVFTYDASNSDLAPGLFAEAGAMRLPGKDGDANDIKHYLTDGYIKQFNLKTQPFINYDKNGISKIYEFQDKTIEWTSKYFDKVWPKWREGIKSEVVHVKDIDDYYKKTTGVVADQLRAWLNKNHYDDVNYDIKQWNRWIRIWSQFTMESFLMSTLDAILAKVKGSDRDDLDLNTIGNLLPWSNDALRGYSVSSYNVQLDLSLVALLRDQLGGWWSENMHCLVGGMETLPKAFFSDNVEDSKLDKRTDVVFNQSVTKIAYTFCKENPSMDSVTVTCYQGKCNEEIKYQGKAALVTLPVNILRQITFKPYFHHKEKTMEGLRKTQQAIEDIFTEPSTKIFIQTKRRFWEDQNIHGGFSITNLPIGQIHYVKHESENQKKGLLMIYTWKSEALIFGSRSEEQVKREVIEQIAEIHPEINEDGMVEKCIVHAWYSQPSYQGAFALLKTTQYDNIRYLWEPTLGNVFFAGENISFTNGWIQGALESGLKTAYQVYQRHMHRKQQNKYSRTSIKQHRSVKQSCGKVSKIS